MAAAPGTIGTATAAGKELEWKRAKPKSCTDRGDRLLELCAVCDRSPIVA